MNDPYREFALWLHQRNARTSVFADQPDPHPHAARPPGDPFQLRGIPVIGVPGGIGATYPNDRQGHELAVLRAEEAARLE
jgi:hypothetical protein